MIAKKRPHVPRWVLAAGDMLLVNAGLFFAFYARFGVDLQDKQANYRAFLEIGPLITLAALVLFVGMRLYATTPVDFVDTLKGLVLGVTLLLFVTMALSFWARGFAFPRSVLLLGALFQVGLLALWRVGFWRLDRHLHGERPVMIVAAGEVSGQASGAEELELIKKFLNVPRGWFQLKAIVPWGDQAAVASGLDQVEAVLVAPSVPAAEKARVAELALRHGREVFLVPDLYDILLLNARVGQVDDLPVLEVPSLGLTPGQQWAKRVLDVAVAGCLLFMATPVAAAVALAVRLTSPGSVLFRQERVGQGGRTFMLLKFRSMVEDAEARSGPVLASANDPRVTRVGRILRATRLDELPQLVNVLKGEMSLVGPRPERPFFVEEFAGSLPDYRYRLLVKPGLTGLAQVMGRYSTSAEDKLRYDLYYIRNYSIFQDLKILLHTARVVVSRRASRGVADTGVKEQAAAADLRQAGRLLGRGPRRGSGQHLDR